MVFRGVGERSSGGGCSGRSQQLVALGSMMGADADRIVVKRIILTGYPTRVHKRNATVKYMFYNPDDVNVSDLTLVHVYLSGCLFDIFNSGL